MDRLTKRVVLGWTCAAFCFEIWLLTSGWPNLPLQMLAAVLIAALLSLFSRTAVSFLLIASYAFPVMVRVWHGGAPYQPHEAVWMAPFFAAMLPDLARTPWNIPGAWRAALVAAALVIVVTSPLVILREIDVNPGLLVDSYAWYWGGMTWPSIVVTWSLHTSLTLVIGLWWFDWLSGARELDFHGVVLTPLVVSGVMLVGVLIYQLVFDLGFLNDTVYAVIGRATGTMYDANVSGTLAALWIGGGFLWARRVWPRHGAVALGLVVANWLAVWATGSRTAFAAASIVTVFIGVSLAKGREGSPARLMKIGGAVAVALVIVAAVVGVVGPRIAGPLSRAARTLPEGLTSPTAVAAELWNRNGYGTAAMAILRQEPWFGIGPGMFHSFATDFLPEGLPPDNAQNWLRHQLVEFGLLGSLGWLVWFVAFGIFVMRARTADPPAAWVTRGMLLAFAAISMLGMPGQDVMVVITFWSIAFWHVSLVGAPANRPTTRAVWAVVLVGVAIVGVGTARVGATRLRMPVRGLVETWPYSYGFSRPLAGEGKDGYRITHAHAVALVDVPSPWLAVSIRLADASDPPVDVRVWLNDNALLKGQLAGSGPLVAFARQVPPARVRLESATRPAGSRRPFALRAAQPSVLVKWEFLEHAPLSFDGYSRP